MTAWVNLFTHGALRRAAVNPASGSLGLDSVMSVDPPIGRSYTAALDVIAQTVSGASFAPAGTELLWYEVQPGKTVGYERSNANGVLRAADVQSPTLEGKGFLTFGERWQISIVDRSS